MAIYSTHYKFESPADENSSIWRYMSFSKFVALLQNNALYFTVANRFEDRWEGTLPARIKQIMSDEMVSFFEAARLNNAINCWHMREYESATMWKSYAPNGEGVAIKSTFSRLARCFNTRDSTVSHSCHVLIGKVRYDCDESSHYDLSNGYIPLLCKRKYFSDENEIRAVIGGGDLNKLFQSGMHGLNVPIDLNELVEKIYVDPVASDWFLELMKSIVNDRFKVERSFIGEKPLKTTDLPPVSSITIDDLCIKN